MDPFLVGLGGMFVCLALFYLLGLLPSFASRFYPQPTSARGRAAAPVLFACLAIACFQGAGLPVLILVVVAGLTQIVVSRRPAKRIAHPPQRNGGA